MTVVAPADMSHRAVEDICGIRMYGSAEMSRMLEGEGEGVVPVRVLCIGRSGMT
jgi:hypothetical protein